MDSTSRILDSYEARRQVRMDTERIRELARLGANRDVYHPNRGEWETLRDKLFPQATIKA